MSESTTGSGAIELDRLQHGRAPVEVVWFDLSADAPLRPIRQAHRHDYHELFVAVAGDVEHRVDGATVHLHAGSVMLVGRGQVHQLVPRQGFRGIVVRFADELLTGAAEQASPGFLLASSTSCVVTPPQRELEHLVHLVQLLDDELRRPPEPDSGSIVGYLVSTVLLLVRRWQAASTPDQGAAANPDVETLGRFGRLLEAEYQRHHDAAWYAGQLGISPGHLASVLRGLTGRSTKQLVTDRVMTEAARLLRYTDLTVQQVALRLGFDDPLYLSRAFKKHAGASPVAFRDHARRPGG